MAMSRWLCFYVVVALVAAESARGDFASDQKECAPQLAGLATCLPYVQGTGNAPTPDCCQGLTEVLGKSRKCLCVLIRDRDNPGLGFKINATRALALPAVCHAPSNISECPKLLNMDPNSQEAQIFKDGGSGAQGSSSAASGSGSGGVPRHERSGGRRRNHWGMVELVVGGAVFLLLPLVMMPPGPPLI